MMLRNSSNGAFEVYDIVNNHVTSANNLGTVGLNWQVAGFADFNGDGTTDICATVAPAPSRSTTSTTI